MYVLQRNSLQEVFTGQMCFDQWDLPPCRIRCAKAPPPRFTLSNLGYGNVPTYRKDHLIQAWKINSATPTTPRPTLQANQREARPSFFPFSIPCFSLPSLPSPPYLQGLHRHQRQCQCPDEPKNLRMSLPHPQSTYTPRPHHRKRGHSPRGL